MNYPCETFKKGQKVGYRQYIEMCKMAEKLQKDHILQRGDCFYHSMVGVQRIVIIVNGKITATDEKGGVNLLIDECIWLPTESQLEKMVDKSKLDEFLEGGKVLSYHPDSRKNKYKTIEERLLAQYMHKNYKLEWSRQRKEWVKTEELEGPKAP